MLDQDTWFVSKQEPRSKLIFENNNVIMHNEEDNEGDGNME